MKGYFSAHIESVRKDVECVFGILKKRWKILEYGIRFRDIKVVEKVFVVCCMLRNSMLSEMETRDTYFRVGRGAPIPGDAIWLRGVIDAPRASKPSEQKMAMEWGKRRRALLLAISIIQRKSRRGEECPLTKILNIPSYKIVHVLTMVHCLHRIFNDN